MEYYLISLIITVIIFGIIQIVEYRRISHESNYSQETYSLLSINNILLLVIIYIVITIASYLLYSSNLSSYFNFNFKNKGGSVDTNYTIKEELNPQVISKINDNFDIGLDPFNSDTSSVSSMSSSGLSSNSGIDSD